MTKQRLSPKDAKEVSDFATRKGLRLPGGLKKKDESSIITLKIAGPERAMVELTKAIVAILAKVGGKVKVPRKEKS